MAGDALTNAFVLSSATVMLGPPASLWDLTPNDAVGLVKNFSFKTDPSYVSLTQGRGKTIYSVMTALNASVSMDVFEYTSQNVGYSLNTSPMEIEGVGTPYALEASVNQGDTYVFFQAGSNVLASFPVGGWIAIQDLGELDYTHVAEIISSTASVGPNFLHQVEFRQPSGAFSLNSRVMAVNVVDFGTDQPTPTFGVKITGFMADDKTPLSILFPKARTIGGFNINFSDAFSSMPLKLQPMSLLPTDALFNDFRDGACARAFVAPYSTDSRGYIGGVPLPTTNRYLLLRNGNKLVTRTSIPFGVRQP